MGPPATPSCLLATAHTPAGVLVASDANPDLIVRGDVVPRFGQVEQLADAADLVLGGSASIVACGLARLGVPTALAARVGRDGRVPADVATVGLRMCRL